MRNRTDTGGPPNWGARVYAWECVGRPTRTPWQSSLPHPSDAGLKVGTVITWLHLLHLQLDRLFRPWFKDLNHQLSLGSAAVRGLSSPRWADQYRLTLLFFTAAHFLQPATSWLSGAELSNSAQPRVLIFRRGASDALHAQSPPGLRIGAVAKITSNGGWRFSYVLSMNDFKPRQSWRCGCRALDYPSQSGRPRALTSSTLKDDRMPRQINLLGPLFRLHLYAVPLLRQLPRPTPSSDLTSVNQSPRSHLKLHEARILLRVREGLFHQVSGITCWAIRCESMTSPWRLHHSPGFV